jgi:hypothetical protein
VNFAIYFDGELTLNEVVQIFQTNGYHAYSDGAGRTIVSRVPRFLQKPPITNVIRMPGRVRRKA